LEEDIGLSSIGGRNRESLIEKIKSPFLKIAGYLVLLIQSVPVWTGLMTLPFAGYLIVILSNIPVNLPKAFSDLILFLFYLPFLILEKIFVVLGVILLFYSIVYLHLKKQIGLVKTGPYQWMRHPQYIGMILITLGVTGWSIWILNNTFGIGFLNSMQTVIIWFVELFTYILIAYLEEIDLSKKYGKDFENYKKKVPFFIPLLKTSRKELDLILSILIPAILLVIMLQLH